MDSKHIIDIVQIAANLATAGAFIFVAIQFLEQRKAVKAQTKATEIETYVSIDLELLNTINNFKDHINNPEIKLADLNPEEIRIIDKYFYLANIEYIMILEKTVRGELADHWIRGLKSSAKRTPFIERWEQSANKYALNEKFTNFYNDEIAKNKLNQKMAAANRVANIQ